MRRAHLGRWITLLALLVASAARPADHEAPSDARKYLDAAKRLYQRLEYERALDQLGKARQGSLGVADNVQIALYEGLVLCEMNREEEGRAAFQAALYLDAHAELPIPVSPKVQGVFEGERKRIQAELARKKEGPNEATTSIVVREKEDRPASSGWIVFAAGGAVAAAGGVCLVLAHQDYIQLTGSAPIAVDVARQRASQGQSLQIAGDIALGVGLVTAAAGAGVVLFGGHAERPFLDTPMARLVPAGPGMALVGTF